MNKALIGVILLFTLNGISSAEDIKGEIVTATVHGMVCEFCAIGLEKQFEKREEVKDIAVSLEAGTVELRFHPGQQLDDEVITKIITDNGIAVAGINRTATNTVAVE